MLLIWLALVASICSTRRTYSFLHASFPSSRSQNKGQRLLLQVSRKVFVPFKRSKLCTVKALPEPSASDVTQMDQLIIKFSLEQNDETRRQALVNLFTEELSKSEGVLQQFVECFDKCLIKIGDEVRQQAMNQVILKQQQPLMDKKSTLEEMDDRVVEPDFVSTKAKTKTEMQVWALVDMMIQSKMIVKKFRENDGK
jgi:hypothetical protein